MSSISEKIAGMPFPFRKITGFSKQSKIHKVQLFFSEVSSFSLSSGFTSHIWIVIAKYLHPNPRCWLPMSTNKTKPTESTGNWREQKPQSTCACGVTNEYSERIISKLLFWITWATHIDICLYYFSDFFWGDSKIFLVFLPSKKQNLLADERRTPTLEVRFIF